MRKIRLGDNVRCKYTGFIGVAMAKTEFLNGCIQFDVAPKVNKDNKLEDAVGLDIQSLELVKEPKKKIVKSTTGGPNKAARKMRGY